MNRSLRGHVAVPAQCPVNFPWNFSFASAKVGKFPRSGERMSLSRHSLGLLFL